MKAISSEQSMDGRLDLSIVVPLFNEEECVAPLVEAVSDALRDVNSWELVLVDDGSSDDTATCAFRQANEDSRVKIVRLARNFGQTAAMQAGFDQSRGSVVVSMDGDLQNDPADIMPLVAKLKKGYDLVAGYRVGRQDHISRKIPSWLANRIIRWLTGVKIRDNGCSLKAYRRDLLQRLHLYSDMHRFIPAIAASVAGARIAEVAVRHHARTFGRSKYGFSRIWKVLADLLTIKMIRSFRDRPLLMFGIGSVVSIGIASVFGIVAAIAIDSFGEQKANAFVLPGTAMLFAALSVYLAMLGMIGEVALTVYRKLDSEQPPLAR